MSQSYVLAIDQGTTSTRVTIFDDQFNTVGKGQQLINSHYPENGWVEQSTDAIWQSVLDAYQQALQQSCVHPSDIHALGITNQRETTVIWDRATGAAIYPAIVWQDRRTHAICKDYKDNLPETCDKVHQKTGLFLDPYFSATKINWILEHVNGARERAENGELAFGTIDSFLLWKLTNGRYHGTDATNASRTLLYNIDKHQWDEELLALFNIPPALLPDVQNCGYAFGLTDPAIMGHAIPISGIAGDQHAALIGHGCLKTGSAKMTYGTGGFLMVNTGQERQHSNHQLLSTMGYQLDGKAIHALEGSLFMAGATMQWLQEQVNILDNVADSEFLAKQVQLDHGVYLVPAFTGLGAPHWRPDARGAIFGLTRNTGKAELTSAALQSVAYQTYELITCLQADGIAINSLSVDGGMAKNIWLMQFLADILDIPVLVPEDTDTTLRGIANVAGFHAGIYPNLAPEKQANQQQFNPIMSAKLRTKLLNGWQTSVKALLGSL